MKGLNVQCSACELYSMSNGFLPSFRYAGLYELIPLEVLRSLIFGENVQYWNSASDRSAFSFRFLSWDLF